MGWDWLFPLIPYDETWKARRRLFHQEFNMTSARKFHPHQLSAAHSLLRHLLENAGRWEAHLRQ